MRKAIAALAAVLSLAGPALAAEPHTCSIPSYLLFSGNELKRVAATVAKDRRLTVAVVGTGSSALAGP
ncbi:MAG TPA: SGNH/GDSL hydrolase family protein, partial [Xanthobacteraceae bacterium]|nr:SGNH/GDSL hydrolase family protein [Xanthobacteraceae bacterium]